MLWGTFHRLTDAYYKHCNITLDHIFLPDHIPADLRDPFYTDQYDQEHIKPLIIRLLLSAELYCRVCGLILHAEQAASLHSHQSVLQALSRKGLYVLQMDNTAVSDLDLGSAPIKMVGGRCTFVFCFVLFSVTF